MSDTDKRRRRYQEESWRDPHGNVVMIAVINSNDDDEDEDNENDSISLEQEEEEEDESYFTVCQSAENFSFDSSADVSAATNAAVTTTDNNNNNIIHIPRFLQPLLGMEYLPSLPNSVAETISTKEQTEGNKEEGPNANNVKWGEPGMNCLVNEDNAAVSLGDHINTKESHEEEQATATKGKSCNKRGSHIPVVNTKTTRSTSDLKKEGYDDHDSPNDKNLYHTPTTPASAASDTPSRKSRLLWYRILCRNSPDDLGRNNNNNQNGNTNPDVSDAVVVTPRLRRPRTRLHHHLRGEYAAEIKTNRLLQQQLDDIAKTTKAVQQRVNELQLSIQKTRAHADQLQQNLTWALQKLDSQTLELTEAQEELIRLETQAEKIMQAMTLTKEQQPQISPFRPAATSPDVPHHDNIPESFPYKLWPSTEPRCRRHHRPQLEWRGRRRAATAEDDFENDDVGQQEAATSPMATMDTKPAPTATTSPIASETNSSARPVMITELTPPSKLSSEASAMATTIQEQAGVKNEQAGVQKSPPPNPARVLLKTSSDSFMRVDDLSEPNEDTSTAANDDNDDSGASGSLVVGGYDCGSSSRGGGGDGRSLYFLDDNLPWVLDKLWHFAFSIVTDESDRFRDWSGNRIGPHNCTILLDETYQTSTSESPSTTGWSILPWHEPVNDKEVLVWVGDVPRTVHGHEWPVVKVRGVVPNVSPRQLVEFLLDSSQVPIYNKMSQGRQDVNVIQESLDTTQEESVYGFTGVAKITRALIKPRLFPKTIETVSMWHARPLESAPGSYMIVNRSVWEDKTGGKGPASSNNNNGMLRSEMLLGVMLCRPWSGCLSADGDNIHGNCCELTTITHVLPQGVPEIMAKRMAPSTAATTMQHVQAHFRNQQQ